MPWSGDGALTNPPCLVIGTGGHKGIAKNVIYTPGGNYLERKCRDPIEKCDPPASDRNGFSLNPYRRGSRIILGTDVYLKRPGKAPENISHCDGAACGQPSLSPDWQAVVYIKAVD